MLRRLGVRRLWIELTVAVIFAVAALVLGTVYADEPHPRGNCAQGLPALQIELISTQTNGIQCNSGERRQP